MAQGHQLAAPAIRVPASQATVLGSALLARGYFAVTSGTITDDMINEYINEQEGEPVEDDGRFQIDPS